MDAPDLAAGLPERVRVVRASQGVLAVREELADAFLAAGYGPDDRPRPEAADAVGKRPLGRVVAGGREHLVRRFHHGGLLRWLTGARFASPERPFDEWRLQERLAQLGVATPRVVAARAQRAWPGGWLLDLATERVEDAEDLGRLLARRRDGELADGPWRGLLAGAGRFVARLHELGFEHADLTPRNLLAERAGLAVGEPRLWVLDLDGSRLVEGGLSAERRAANLGRLDRHLRRMAREHGAGLSRSDRGRFLAGYAPPRAERQRLAGLMDGAPDGGLHRLGWGLERLLGRGRGSAEAHLRRESSRT